eukprot:gnl/TRDRNA2_/TRDRNA2_166410_c0_seq2.p2 gnl/TRDRNA2_/TRDRNA2_166410_c0~~gnl/TRDRNA2_/TRDRNA2_166410_c0_seq2.p2  ORF type:complete len:131 (+),score=22.14 gnl/TRDRNA2_/TRDRNA2_166410_c0_seq2:71-463(+)
MNLGLLSHRTANGACPLARERPTCAVDLFRSAAKQGHAAAQLRLGEMLACGDHGSDPDPDSACRWWREAARQGLAEAQYRLALALLSHTDCDDDSREKEGLHWLREAAEQDEPSAIMYLSVRRGSQEFCH